jgi:YhcH/YjgK/YiaL family protein
MIFDRVENLDRYHTGFRLAKEFILRCPVDMAYGTYHLNDAGLFARVESYATRTRKEGVIESHIQYIDIQTCLAGAEGMEFFTVNRLETMEVDEEKDLILYEFLNEPSGKVEVYPGDVAVFFPPDAHRPQMITGRGAEVIKKMVIKVPLSDLNL